MAQRKLYSGADFHRESAPLIRESTGPEAYRSPFRRDFARLIHSPSFRRLQGKTQVFPGEESDFFRNRLTHSLEVGQIAKSLALKINATERYFRSNPIEVDLVELAGLAHDLGHPPFGHNGEHALDFCMRDAGGFEGNAQTFRILTRTEKKDLKDGATSPYGEGGEDNRLGLNFCYRSLAAILKYDKLINAYRKNDEKVRKGIYECDKHLFNKVKLSVCPEFSAGGNFKTIECSIMDLSDDIAYSTYDLEDTFKAGFLSPLDIIRSRGDLLEQVADSVTEAIGEKFDAKDILSVFIEIFSDLFAPDVRHNWAGRNQDIAYVVAEIAEGSGQLASNGYLRTRFTADLVSYFMSAVELDFNSKHPKMSRVKMRRDAFVKMETLKRYTFWATIMSPRLRISEQRGFDIIKNMFDKLNDKKGYMLLPQDCRDLFERSKNEAEKKRVICDFIAGMTDRYAAEFYGRIFSENPQSIFKPF